MNKQILIPLLVLLLIVHPGIAFAAKNFGFSLEPPPVVRYVWLALHGLPVWFALASRQKGGTNFPVLSLIFGILYLLANVFSILLFYFDCSDQPMFYILSVVECGIAVLAIFWGAKFNNSPPIGERG